MTEDDDLRDTVVNYADARFEIRPHPTCRHLMQIHRLAEELGYEMPFSLKQYSLEDVQETLRSEGPGAFLGRVVLREDISTKAPLKSAAIFVAERLARLGPTKDLIVVDPYLFPAKPMLDIPGHAALVVELIAPLLEEGASVKCIVNANVNHAIANAAQALLTSEVPDAKLEWKTSSDFHDRFWIADGSRGVVVGASFNGLGSKIFLIDDLKASDVSAVMDELKRQGL